MTDDNIYIRPLESHELEAALSLAWRVFSEYESPDYSPEGTEEFRKCLHDENYLAGIEYYGAFDGERLVGLLGIRPDRCHICFFFVDGEYHRRGIGTRLFGRMLEDRPGRNITLNSSPYGLPFYKRLGLIPVTAEQTVNGIRFTPMVYRQINSAYKVIDRDTYYRRGVFRHFSEDCKCSVSMTARIDVTDLVRSCRERGSRFYLDFLYILTKVLNSREDYRMGYIWQTGELICYDVINPTQYVFHEDTETCTPVYSYWFEDYGSFYACALDDIEKAKQTRDYLLDAENHPNWFDASYISWLSYDSANIELPDGYLYLLPIINWGRYREENGRLMMPLTVRLNHAAADGYLIANVFRLIEKETESFINR